MIFTRGQLVLIICDGRSVECGPISFTLMHDHIGWDKIKNFKITCILHKRSIPVFGSGHPNTEIIRYLSLMLNFVCILKTHSVFEFTTIPVLNLEGIAIVSLYIECYIAFFMQQSSGHFTSFHLV